MSNFPRTVEEVTPEWLTQVLRRSVGSEEIKVSDFSSEEVGGQGINGDLFKLTITYATEVATVPSSVVLKVPKSQSVYSETQANWLNRHETGFYSEIADHVGLTVPIIYFAESDDARNAHTILMQNLEDWTLGDDRAGLTDDQMDLAIRSLAKLHAVWWNNPKLDEFDWITDLEKGGQVTTEQAEELWLLVRDLVEEVHGADMVKFGDLFGSKFEAVALKIGQRPFTLCHGDYKGGNMFFLGDGSDMQQVVIDWQRPQRSNPVRDLGTLLTRGLRGERLKEKADLVLEKYHAELVANGIRDYSFAALKNDIPIGIGIIAIGPMTLTARRPDPKAYLEQPRTKTAVELSRLFDVYEHWEKL